jgi:sugar lactone lactonase YvrE
MLASAKYVVGRTDRFASNRTRRLSPSKEGKKSMKNLVRVSLCVLSVLIFGGAAAHAQTPGIITTVVGGGPAGTVDKRAAAIGSPAAVRQDSHGNIFILDNNFGRVYKSDFATGHISVFAGTGTIGFSGDGGPATAAAMNEPSGMCIDAHDNIFVADSDNAVIREVVVTPIVGQVAGNIYTVAGTPETQDFTYGGDGGPATAPGVHLHFPDGCSFDSHGNMYIADRGNNAIRVVIGTSASVPPGMTGPVVPGNIYLFAGSLGAVPPNPPAGGLAADGAAALGGALYGPFDVFVDSHDNVFIADLGNNFGPNGPNTDPNVTIHNNNVIREVTAVDGKIKTVAGKVGVYGHDKGVPAVGAALNQPIGISVDAAGNLFFADSVNQVIREVPAVAAPGMVVGNIYDVAGNGSKGYAGDTGPAVAASLSFPAGTFVTAGAAPNVLDIADANSDAVRFLSTTGTTGDYTMEIIDTYAGNGRVSFSDGTPATAGQLNTPNGLAVDATGNLFIADAGTSSNTQSLIRSAASPIGTGALSTFAGKPEDNEFSNLPPFVINNAQGVFVDQSGAVYIADTGNCVIRKISAGTIATIAGVEPIVPDPVNHPDTTAPQCGFTTSTGVPNTIKLGFVVDTSVSPSAIYGTASVAVDAFGNVYFSDAVNNVVWQISSATGTASVYAGTPSTTGAYGGEAVPAATAQLNRPTGLFIDVFGNLFIADSGNNLVREVAAQNTASMTAGFIYTVAGNAGDHTPGSSTDGATAVGAKLNTPFTIVVDHAGVLFISDTGNHAVSEVPLLADNGTKLKGKIYRVAGTSGTPGFTGDGAAATSAQLHTPKGLAIDGSGNLLVSDSANNRVRSVTLLANVSAVPAASFDKTSLTFANQTVNVASTPQTITLKNTGSADLTIPAGTAGINVSGTNSAEFTLAPASTCGATLAANATCTISVTFTPTTVDPNHTATLTVADNGGGPHTIALSGSSQNAVAAFALKLDAAAGGSTTATVKAGQTASYSLQITASGGLPTDSANVTFTCTGAPSLATCTVPSAPVTVTSGASVPVMITVKTTGSGMLVNLPQSSPNTQPPAAIPLLPLAALALVFCIVTLFTWIQNPASRLRIIRVALSACLILMPITAATLLVGCGGGSSSPAPPAPPPASTPTGTSMITVTATSGSTTTSTQLTLIVQ